MDLKSCTENTILIFGQCVSPDSYVQTIASFLGAIVGAVLAAAVTIFVFKVQQKMEKKKQRIHELGMFSKCYHSVLLYTFAALEDAKLIIECLKMMSQLQDDDKKENIKLIILNICPRIESSIKIIQSFDYSYIPHGDLFLWFRNINQCLSSIVKTANTQLVRNDSNIDTLENIIEHLRDALENFSKLGIDREKELSRLTNGKEMSYLLNDKPAELSDNVAS